MSIVKRTLYVAFGMVVGVAATLAAQVVQPAGGVTAGARLTAVNAGSFANRPASFVGDAVSGGCWLVIGYGTGDGSPGVAVAPPAACKQ